MMPTTRSRAARSLGALFAAATLLAAAPAPAQAEHRDHDRRGHHRHRHRHDDDCGRRHSHAHHRDAWRPHHGAHAYHHRRGGHRHHRRAYSCERCRKRFSSYDDLYGHVHHHHRVPVWWVPHVLTQVSFGWTFDL